MYRETRCKAKALMIIAMLSVAEAVRIIQHQNTRSNTRAADKHDGVRAAADAVLEQSKVREHVEVLHEQMKADPDLRDQVFELQTSVRGLATVPHSEGQLEQAADEVYKALAQPKIQQQMDHFGEVMRSDGRFKEQIYDTLTTVMKSAQEEKPDVTAELPMSFLEISQSSDPPAFHIPIAAKAPSARRSHAAMGPMKRISGIPKEEVTNFESSVASRRFISGLGSLAVLGASTSAALAATAEPWPTKKFYDELQKGNIERVTIAADGKQVVCVDTDGNRHESLILADQAGDLVKLMQQKDVLFTVQPPQEPSAAGNLLGGLLNFAPFLLFLGLPLLFRGMGQGGGGPGGMGGQMGIGKSQSKIQMEPQTGVTFTDVAGCDGAKLELNEVVDFLKDPSKYSALGAKIPKGVIMEGPPGTGKTLLARAVAGEAGVPFVSASGSEFVEMFVGVGASRVRDLFGQAKKNAPCIVFIDEIDAIGKQRAGGGGMGGGGNDEREQTLNQILTEMDGFEGNTGVIVIAATNRADTLDNALIRPGRFDRRVPVDLPDVKGRVEILKVHIRGKPLSSDIDLGIIAKRTTGFSGAALANLMNEAAIVAARNGKKEIGYEEVDYAIDRQTVGMQKTTGMSFPERQRLVAYHEAGHALMGLLIPDYDMVTKVTIIPRTSGAGGFTLFTPPEERLETGMYSKRFLQEQLCVALGGRVAEEIAYGKDEITTGASNDLQQVRNIARRMVAQWGFANENLGSAPVAWEPPEGNTWNAPRTSSEATEVDIDIQVKNIVSNAYDKTIKTLTENRAFLDEMTQRLVEEETLDYKQLLEMREKFCPDFGKVPVAA
jgi:cell division protease FtsH